MAGPNANDYKFLKTAFLVGFGACALALVLQRRELNKYGYDLHLGAASINNVDDLTTLNIINPDNTPARANDRALKKILDDWKKEGMTYQVYLTSATINPGAAQPNITVTKTPTLVKCDGGRIFAYVNDPAGNVAVHEILPPRVNGDLYKSLNFPIAGDPRARRVVRNITNEAIVNDLTTPAAQGGLGIHLHVSKAHAHQDTRMDNRFLILKNDSLHGPVPAGSPPGTLGPVLRSEYYMYSQDRNGQYHFSKINPANLLQGMDYEHAPFKAGEFTKIKRNAEVISRLLEPIAAGPLSGRTVGGVAVAGDVMAAANPSIPADKLKQYEAANKQKTILFSAAALSAEFPSLVQQAKSSGTYALMNKMGKTPGDTRSLKEKVKDTFAPLRAMLNI